MMLFLLIALVWYAIGFWGVLTMALNEDGELSLGDLPFALKVALLGPFMWLIVLFIYIEQNKNKVIFKKKK